MDQTQAHELLKARVIGVYRQAALSSVGSWSCASVYLFVPNPDTDFWHRLVWYFAMCLSLVLRILIARRFQKKLPEIRNFKAWGALYTLVVGLTAFVWCSTLMLLVSLDNRELLLLTMMTLSALCIGASHASTTYFPAGQIYNIPVLSSIILVSLIIATAIYYAIATLGFVYMAMNYFIGRQNQNHFAEVHALRFELAQQKDEAEKANVAKSKFLAAASHDLRQPMHALGLFTAVLKEGTKESKMLEVVKNIDSSVSALQGLFNSLLDISKLDAGVIEVERASVSLAELFRPIEKEFRVEAEKKSLKLVLNSGDYFVDTDPQLLSRILRNLVSNAVRYTPKGKVSMRAFKESGNIHIEVSDTGLGIPEESQVEIFNEFVQLQNPERDRKKGLGLGLAIVKRIANLLNHKMVLESSMGSGTRFTLTLPVAVLEHKAVADGESQSVSDASIEGARVLVIDDENAIREGLHTLLTAWSCDVECYATKADALQALETGDCFPDVILADYRLQENETGLQAVSELCALAGRPIPAAIITGDTAPDRLAEAKAGGYLLLHKPVNSDEIKKFISENLKTTN